MAYLAAIVNMYQQQVKIGVNNQPHPRKAYIQLLDNMKFNDEHVHRAENQDRGLGTMVDGYKKETDISSIVSYYFSRSSGGDLRNAVSFLLSHFCMLRGEPARKAEFADLQTVILDREEPSECPAFILTLKQGKTNQFGRVELAAYLRNTKVDIYLFIALGFYFFWRWHVDGESFPSIETSDSWFSHKLLRSGQDSTREMTYSTHLEAINRAFKACGIVPTAKTHPARGSSARMADMSGADEADIRRQDRWNSSTMNGAYLTNLPRGAMRTMAGFPSSEGWFYLPRAQDLVWCLPVDSSRTWIPGASEAIKNHFSSGFCANDEKNSRASIVVACYIR